MASYLKLSLVLSFIKTSVLSLLRWGCTTLFLWGYTTLLRRVHTNLLRWGYTTLSLVVGRNEPLFPLEELPAEVLAKVLAFTMASPVPVLLQGFIEEGKKRGESSSTWSYPLWKLLPSQREHYLDWVAINSTSRSLRNCGKLLFFSKKIFLIAPPLLETLMDGSCRNMSAQDKATLLSRAQYVIVPINTRGIATYFPKLPRYRTFKHLRCFSIQIFKPSEQPYQDSDICSLDWETVSTTPMASEPVDSGDKVVEKGPYRRHLPPQDLLDLLRGVGLQVDQIKVDLIYRDTEKSKRWVIDELAEQVYPYLRTMQRNRQIKELAEGQSSSAPR